MESLIAIVLLVFLDIFLYSSNGVDAVSNEITACYDGWLPYRGSCYYFGHDGMDFTSAVNYCQQRHNSHVVRIDDRLENEFIKDNLRTNLKPRYWWLGLTDEDIETVWKWFDTDVTTTFLDWGPGQPNTHADDCSGFAPDLDFRWIDTSCHLHHYPICEVNAPEEHEVVG